MLNNKYNIISENLKKFRKEKKFSQRELCEKLDLTYIKLIYTLLNITNELLKTLNF